MTIDFSKNSDGLVPAIIQDNTTMQVLMLGYMNQAAFEKTLQEGKVTFFSRSKNRLWTKGETSHNYLIVKDVKIDCDQDTILIKAEPQGATCHTGTFSCFGESENKGFLYQLEDTIKARIQGDDENSYTKKLYEKGINKMAQKVGEEAVEMVIEAKDSNDNLFLDESADLMFHYLLLLQAKGFGLSDIEGILKQRHEAKR